MKEIRACECGASTLEPYGPNCPTPSDHYTSQELDELTDDEAIDAARQAAPLLYDRIVSGEIVASAEDEKNAIAMLPPTMRAMLGQGGNKLHKGSNNRRR